jgi:hypothetical protein
MLAPLVNSSPYEESLGESGERESPAWMVKPADPGSQALDARSTRKRNYLLADTVSRSITHDHRHEHLLPTKNGQGHSLAIEQIRQPHKVGEFH